MSEVEKQEGQKTVVAFIAGLLIGGLLVWVFSASPTDDKEELLEEAAEELEEGADDLKSDITDAGKDTNNSQAQEAVGKAAITVVSNLSGKTVELSDVEYPTNEGWIVVREYNNETPGSILGAARYSKSTGLLPTTVNLLRATKSEQVYQVIFFSESGDKIFDLNDDLLIEGYTSTFTAK